MNRIEYVHPHDLSPLLFGLLYEGLKGSNWKPAKLHEDGKWHDPDNGQEVDERAVYHVSLDVYDISRVTG